MDNRQSHCLVDDLFLMEQLKQLTPVSLDQIQKVELMHRKDTKYLFHINQLGALLSGIKQHYKILTIDKKRIFSYQSHYYDTNDFAMYLQQHNGKSNRYKVRSRTYLDSRQSFIEVKYKSNKEHTFKERARLGKTNMAAFVEAHTPYKFADLSIKLVVNFSRTTLVDNELTERITIDTGLLYRANDKVYHFPELVILEIKQERGQSHSKINQWLLNMRIRQAKISKYSLGITMHYNTLKQNRFKEKYRYLQKVMNQYG